ncbi:MAG: hypothetical protein JNM90_23220 [Burkholderiales bacterium]|nr:hypothetical protein [Burkholderiales bacterium]
MKPSVEDQLRGTCRILENVVAPCVGDPFARTILDNLAANLRMLTGALPAVVRFLRDDNTATADLLGVLRPSLPAALRARIDAALAEPAPDAVDGAALEARNDRLRGLLAEAVVCEGLGAEQHRAIVRLMSERAARMPMRYVPTVSHPPPAARP